MLNLLVLAFGLGLQYVEANRMPAVAEFNADKIRMWSQPEAYRPEAAAGAGDTASSQSANAVETPAPAQAPDNAPAPADLASASTGQACLSVGELTQERFQDLQKLLRDSGLTSDQCRYLFDKKLVWWVFWPPEYEAARRTKVLAAIHAAGVKDVMAITQGALSQAFSVGVFKSEDQARLYRDRLRSRGLDKIEYGPRPTAGPGRLACTVDNQAQLAQLKASLPAWIEPTDPQQCPAAAE